MFIQAKKKREELRLPILHFIVADDWMDKLGPQAFTAWLKFHTWVNRQDQRTEDVNQAKIPMSMEKVAEKLGIGKTTLYRSIIPILWEYGLIDLVEYEDSQRKTQKPVNIIPYDYPQNNKQLETKPLEKCRDWKKDYTTVATFYARQGGRKPSVEPSDNRSKNETVDRSKNETVTVPKMKPNNVSNNSNNLSNTSNNESNINLSIKEGIKKLDLPATVKIVLQKQIDRLIEFKINIQDIELHFHAVKDTYTLSEYAYVLNALLSNMNQSPDNLQSVLNNWLKRNRDMINNVDEKKLAVGSKPVREEIVPEWINNQQAAATESEESNEAFLERKEKLEAKLKSKYGKKKAQ